LAVVTNARLYRLGEDDGGCLPSPGKDPTLERVANVNASKRGLAFYHGSSPSTSLGLAPGSTCSMEFTNTDSRYVAPAFMSPAENFGLEAYLEISPVGADARAFHNGDSGFPTGPLSRGYGIGTSGGFYVAFVGSSVFATAKPATAGKAVQMALVNTGGTHFEVYVDRSLVLSFSSAVPPIAPSDVISIGNFVSNLNPPAFSGVVDEARVFTFAPGAFDPNVDLGAARAASPVPALRSRDLILLVLLLVSVAIWLGKRRRPSVRKESV